MTMQDAHAVLLRQLPQAPRHAQVEAGPASDDMHRDARAIELVGPLTSAIETVHARTVRLRAPPGEVDDQSFGTAGIEGQDDVCDVGPAHCDGNRILAVGASTVRRSTVTGRTGTGCGTAAVRREMRSKPATIAKVSQVRSL